MMKRVLNDDDMKHSYKRGRNESLFTDKDIAFLKAWVPELKMEILSFIFIKGSSETLLFQEACNTCGMAVLFIDHIPIEWNDHGHEKIFLAGPGTMHNRRLTSYHQLQHVNQREKCLFNHGTIAVFTKSKQRGYPWTQGTNQRIPVTTLSHTPPWVNPNYWIDARNHLTPTWHHIIRRFCSEECHTAAPPIDIKEAIDHLVATHVKIDDGKVSYCYLHDNFPRLGWTKPQDDVIPWSSVYMCDADSSLCAPFAESQYSDMDFLN